MHTGAKCGQSPQITPPEQQTEQLQSATFADRFRSWSDVGLDRHARREETASSERRGDLAGHHCQRSRWILLWTSV